CETLQVALSKSFPYARKFVLPTLIDMYRGEAARCWGAAKYLPLREVFCKSVDHELPADWERRWVDNGFPPAGAGAFVLDDSCGRLPNPVAYLVREGLWPKDVEFGVTVPWIASH